MEKYEYVPQGVCSRRIILTIDKGIVLDVQFVGGCPGNALGIASLIKGMRVEEVTSKLSGIMCGNKKTSCPNELAKFLKDFKKEK